MTQTQHGQGTTPERAKRGKIETTETINAGEIAQRERWPDIVAFMLDEGIGMLLQDEAYGWQAFTQLKAGDRGNGNGGEGWKYEEWLRFKKIIGHQHLTVMEVLWEYPIPQFGNQKQVDESLWRLGRCLGRVRDALRAAEKAAQKAHDEIEAKKDSVMNKKPTMPEKAGV